MNIIATITQEIVATAEQFVIEVALIGTGITINSGGESAKSTKVDFAIPSTQWDVSHNKGSEPVVSVIVNGEVVDAEVIHNSINDFSVKFTAPQFGSVSYI